MNIIFSPIRSDATLLLERLGDTLIINGESFDFSPLQEGDELPQEAISSSWIAGPVSRVNGVLNIKLLLPHGANAPYETKFPNPISVLEDGLISLPAYSLPEEEESEV